MAGPEATAQDKELVAGKTVTLSKTSLKPIGTGDCCASCLWATCL
jgi:hypothetical protein